MGKNESIFLAKVDYLFCIVLALAFTSAPYYMNTGECHITLGYCLSALVLYIIFLYIVQMSRKHLSKLSMQDTSPSHFVGHCIESILNNKRSILLLTLLIFICWIIPLLFLYPGTFINDTWSELQQYISFTQMHGVLQDHHPIFDTLILGILIVPLAQATGRWHIVIFLYILLQAFFTSFSFAYAIDYFFKKLHIGYHMTLFLLFTYCFLPLYPASVQTVSKDALFSWIFVLFSIHFIEIIRSNGDCLYKKAFLFRLSSLALLCCLTKKVGFYVIFLSLAFVIIFQKRNRKFVFVPLICISFLMYGIMPFIRTELHVIPGGKQEMFSLPFQMTARYVKEYGDDITSEEYDIIDKVLTMSDLAERYNPTNADPVKDYYQKGTDEDYVEYLKVWIKQGIRHPKSYIVAFNSMLAGWFSWSEYDPVMNMDWRNQHDTKMIPEWVPVRGKSEVTANAYQEFYHALYKIPFIQIFLSYGFYASLIPAFAVSTALKNWKKSKYWLAILPTIFSLQLGCWLSPVSTELEGKRYLYPITYTAPLLIAWCVYVYKKNQTQF